MAGDQAPQSDEKYKEDIKPDNKSAQMDAIKTSPEFAEVCTTFKGIEIQGFDEKGQAVLSPETCVPNHLLPQLQPRGSKIEI